MPGGIKPTHTASGPNRPQDPTRDSILRDPRWKRFSAGQSSPSERAELAALSKTHPLYEEAFQLFRPWSEEESMAVLEAARAAVDSKGAPRAGAARAANSSPQSEPPTWPRKAARSTRRYPRRTAVALCLGAVAIASAAAAAAVFQKPPALLAPFALESSKQSLIAWTTKPNRIADNREPLPGYSIVGAARAPAESMQLGPGDILDTVRERNVSLAPRTTLDATFVPEKSIQGELLLNAYLIAQGKITRWRPEGSGPQLTGGGRVVIRGTREQLFGTLSETVEVVLVVSRPGSTPTDSAEWQEYLSGRASTPKDLNAQIERLKVSFIDSYP